MGHAILRPWLQIHMPRIMNSKLRILEVSDEISEKHSNKVWGWWIENQMSKNMNVLLKNEWIDNFVWKFILCFECMHLLWMKLKFILAKVISKLWVHHLCSAKLHFYIHYKLSCLNQIINWCIFEANPYENWQRLMVLLELLWNNQIRDQHFWLKSELRLKSCKIKLKMCSNHLCIWNQQKKLKMK